MRPYVIASAAVSLDGYIDDVADARLLLSDDEDLDRVDEVRAWSDALLVGAGTIRADDPRLLVRSAERRAARVAAGRPASPAKVTLTRCGKVDPHARFFTAGDTARYVYTCDAQVARLQRTLTGATVVGAGDPLTVERLLHDLHERGIERLMVEGGGAVHTLFLAAGVVDELHVVYAPFFVGQPKAPRFVNAAAFPQGPGNRMTLGKSRQIGDLMFLQYFPRSS
ncbi:MULTISPECIES: dihydrofolate reductase family protein [Pseudonocardia]|uniref:5-amino-6-(5-phosphoribosylamino)uracil reductase n=1 Tax=Pseudonocardia oroxyli TaxID=366584 RepID=A0A1G7VTR7_PSEOR|nr:MULTISPECIES: dihydrofolate reductase family protein [Pseudonocardia]MCF7553453.1 dihydrofolate reductase family protein [Pseudonocardia sp. WMMC193]SDG63196.1 5-amino-6-(5-phosphoribosylamino)uracil reductase [Pseudonocardia oroxyli]